jgi:hypothetical protein
VSPADYHRFVAMTRGPAGGAGPEAAVPAPDTCGEDCAPGPANPDSTQNLICAAQAAGVLLALVVVAVWPGAWPVDPAIALGIAAWSAWEGHRSWTGADCC